MQRTGAPKRGKLFFGVLWFLFLGCLSGMAFGYTLKTDTEGTPLYWEETPTLYWAIDPAVEDDGHLEEALADAISAWADFTPHRAQVVLEQPTTFDDRVYEGERPCPGTNCVVWTRHWPWEAKQLSMTFLTYAEPGGEIKEADIVINGETVNWGEDGFDLTNALTHEVGHLLGLAHSEETQATMYALSRPREVKKRSLHLDDVAGVQEIYGVGERTLEADRSGCSQESTVSGLALALGLLALAFRSWFE